MQTARGMLLRIVKIVFGSAVAAVSFRYLTYPNNIVSGGVTGICQILNLLFGLPVGVMTIVLNIPLFLLARKTLGRSFVIYSGICMVLVSAFIDLLEPIASPVTTDPLLSAVYGGLLNGLGYGVIYTTGTTAGGTDILTRLMRRKMPYLNFGTISLSLNAAIIVVFAVIFHNFESCMYTVICMYICNKVVDLLLYGPSNSRLCYIISDHSEELRDAITHQLGRGVTMLKGTGAWSGKDKQVILCVIKPVQIGSLRRLVREIDVSAFLVVGDARCVYGHGFDNIQEES